MQLTLFCASMINQLVMPTEIYFWIVSLLTLGFSFLFLIAVAKVQICWSCTATPHLSSSQWQTCFTLYSIFIWIQGKWIRLQVYTMSLKYLHRNSLKCWLSVEGHTVVFKMKASLLNSQQLKGWFSFLLLWFCWLPSFSKPSARFVPHFVKLEKYLNIMTTQWL